MAWIYFLILSLNALFVVLYYFRCRDIIGNKFIIMLYFDWLLIAHSNAAFKQTYCLIIPQGNAGNAPKSDKTK